MDDKNVQNSLCITSMKQKLSGPIEAHGPFIHIRVPMLFFGYSGGGGGIDNQTGPILLPSYPLTYINLHIKYGSNNEGFFNYRENDEVSADAANAADAA